jgi:hypothetical protein
METLTFKRGCLGTVSRNPGTDHLSESLTAEIGVVGPTDDIQAFIKQIAAAQDECRAKTSAAVKAAADAVSSVRRDRLRDRLAQLDAEAKDAERAAKAARRAATLDVTAGRDPSENERQEVEARGRVEQLTRTRESLAEELRLAEAELQRSRSEAARAARADQKAKLAAELAETLAGLGQVVAEYLPGILAQRRIIEELSL